MNWRMNPVVSSSGEQKLLAPLARVFGTTRPQWAPSADPHLQGGRQEQGALARSAQ